MATNRKILYVSYDGMTDPLGQSQVIPYLIKLTECGHSIHILSAEKPQNFEKRGDFIANLLRENKISWHYISYTKKPPVISTIIDVFKFKKVARKLHKAENFDIVHCRSYIGSFVGTYLKRKFSTKYIFDMRGFYADERVDGNIWPQSNIVYRLVYNYFKRCERKFFTKADYTISLTTAGKDIIHGFKGLENIPIEVIPCCADTELFDYNNLDSAHVYDLRKQIGLTDSDFVVTYLGSLGTWYMCDEMMRFFKLLLERKSNSKFLFISRDNPELIYSLADKYGVNRSSVVIKPANREEVPMHIAVGNVSLFFIKPVFSKKASSPTKLAELLGMGMPVICNSNVGDMDKFMHDTPFGFMLDSFTDEEMLQVIDKIDNLQSVDKAYLRKIATDLFSLEVGYKIYNSVYEKI